MNSKQMAQGLAWFGIGLGLAELLAPRAVARAAGLERHARLIQVFGMREILAGLMILVADNPEAWLWTRVAGDGMDGALLASGMGADNPERARTLLATIAVAPVVALDILYAPKSLDG